MNIEAAIGFIKQRVPFQYYTNDFPKTDNGNCGFVRFNDGAPPDLYLVGLTSPSMQIAIRHESGREAEKIANEIWKLFHAKAHFYIEDTYVHIAMCDQSMPVYVGTDGNDRSVYSINVSMKVTD